jgi:hypothetical protein
MNPIDKQASPKIIPTNKKSIITPLLLNRRAQQKTAGRQSLTFAVALSNAYEVS